MVNSSSYGKEVGVGGFRKINEENLWTNMKCDLKIDSPATRSSGRVAVPVPVRVLYACMRMSGCLILTKFD